MARRFRCVEPCSIPSQALDLQPGDEAVIDLGADQPVPPCLVEIEAARPKKEAPAAPEKPEGVTDGAA